MITWQCKAFDMLTPYELYAILRLRNAVFVVEQQCVFQDADNKDQSSFHLMGWENGNLAAYVRLVPPGLSYEEASIGRVVTDPRARGRGTGRELMKIAIRECRDKFGSGIPIRIGAQTYLREFYLNFGFFPIGGTYIEDGIPHIEMLLS